MKVDGFEQKISLGASDISAYNKMKTSPDEEGHQRLQAIPSRKCTVLDLLFDREVCSPFVYICVVYYHTNIIKCLPFFFEIFFLGF